MKKPLSLIYIQIMAFLVRFRGIRMLLKFQDNFHQTHSCFITICSITEGKKGALLNYCVSRVLSNCLPQNVLIWGGDFNYTIYNAKDRNYLESHPPSVKELSSFTHLWFNWCGRGILICKIGNIHDSVQMLISFPATQDKFWTYQKHLKLLKMSYIHSNSYSFADYSLVVLNSVSSSLKLLTCMRVLWHAFSKFLLYLK